MSVVAGEKVAAVVLFVVVVCVECMLWVHGFVASVSVAAEIEEGWEFGHGLDVLVLLASEKARLGFLRWNLPIQSDWHNHRSAATHKIIIEDRLILPTHW